MKRIKSIVCLTLVSVLYLSAGELKITVNRSNGLLTLSYPVTNGVNYSLVRVDMNTGYIDTYTNWTSKISGTNTFTVNPMLPSDEDQPAPSGQCYFYVVSQ
jgi:hypothetical protein